MDMSMRSKKRTIAAAGASLALAAAIVGTGVGLASPSSSAWAATMVPGIDHVRQATPTPPTGRPNGGPGQGNRPSMQQRQQDQEAYLSALASKLGVSVDALKAAMKQARIDTINKAVADGKLDRARADQIIAAIQSGQHPGPGQRGQQGPGGQRGPGGQQGPRMGFFGGPGLAAEAMGIPPQQLRTEWQGDKTLADVGQAHGLNKDQLKQKMLDLQKTQLATAAQQGKLTQQQADQMIARLTANIDNLLGMKAGQGRPQGAPGTGR